MEVIDNFITSGGEYQKHHQWCIDQFKIEGHDVSTIVYNDKTMLNRIGKKFGIKNLQLEVDCIRNGDSYDLLFLPQDISHSVIALCRALNICKSPIFAILHFSYNRKLLNVGHRNGIHLLLKKVKSKLESALIFNYFDQICFLGEKTLELAIEGNRIPVEKRNFADWGADFDFFNDFRNSQLIKPTTDFLMANGGSNRDYPLLIEAFKKLPITLKIFGRLDETKSYKYELPKNVIINNKIVPGLSSVAKLREEYYNCLAVAIPLKKSLDTATGGTVMLEAIAMGKPLLVTNNKAFFFDVEREKVGFKIDFGDVEGWRQAVQYLVNHPEEVKEMGERALYLAKNKYNYNNFSKSISRQINNFFDKKKPLI